MADGKTNIPNGAPASKHADMRQRIISHMNKDHSSSLVLYLRNYCQIPVSLASSAKMTDVTTSYMIIESGWGRNMIPFEPPMKSLAEARERVVAMHNDSLKALDLSDTKVDKFVLPNKLWQWTLHMLCAWCFSTLHSRSLLDPKSGSLVPYIWSLGGTVPAIARLNYDLAPLVFWGMIAIHSAEASWMGWSRLRRHQVPIGSFTWIAWVLTTFNGGVASFTRFDEYVKKLEERKKKNDGKH